MNCMGPMNVRDLDTPPGLHRFCAHIGTRPMQDKLEWAVSMG